MLQVDDVIEGDANHDCVDGDDDEDAGCAECPAVVGPAARIL